MAQKEIIWSDLAKSELQDTLEFYLQRNKSPSYSLKLLKEIEDLLKTLSKSEFIGRLTVNKKTRVIPMNVYLIFYEIKKDTIEIVSFWDNRQDNNNITT
ncbi:type II toxin-antitoxin system RelE/ParE family toxin [Mesonia sp. MT50]|uniref:Type II toxin-antitoxin system RelE/ParE family toxin n=1 Tax=Mesonia profundi TaxID=3070998 RepID=A0ABU1A5U8_9FLAO|nr:type II toxin-antitoxin system RelE/ParE family toxin [Mesonia profundi]MDQ7918399.1 type II toxin-antitoxin system RelE/ParE family toxin [Mesonia profundi]